MESPAKRIGPYEILSTVGEGGMGVVYRGRDTRLGREVAIKVLPPSFRCDPERLARFEREARAVGALSHPNVLVIHEVGSDDGSPYLVTELLEGQTLRERLAAGPVPVRKALDWAVQIARGLAAAHEKCIVHRDLKPENLFLTGDGVVKLLDFGLAKNTCEPGGKADATASEAVVGTAGYMAPEQVRGRPADERSDIFSFGAILYELLSGQRAFGGDNAVERGHAILSKDPPEFAALGLAVPTALEKLVRRCLEKEPGQRFQSARDLAFALEAFAEAPSQPQAKLTPRTRWRGWSVGALLFAALVGIAIGAVIRWPSWIRTSASELAGPHFTRLTFQRLKLGQARFAPDGHAVVFSAVVENDASRVYSVTPGNPDARSLSEPSTWFRAISGSGEMALLVKSQAAGFPLRTLAIAPLSGGAPREVVEDAFYADFGPGDSLLAMHRVAGKLRLEYPAGKVLLESDRSIVTPRVSPDGRSVAYVDTPSPRDERGTVMVIGPDGSPRALGPQWFWVQGLAWSPDGAEVWIAGGRECGQHALWGLSLDGTVRRILEVSGNLVLHDIARDGRVLIEQADSRLRISGLVPGRASEQDLSWFDGSQPIALSADGRTLLFTEEREAACVPRKDVQSFLRRTDGAPAVRISKGRAWALSPDGKWALVSPQAPFNTLRLVPTGAGEPRDLPSGSLVTILGAVFFPDGRRILLGAREEGHLPRLWILDLEGGAPRPLWKEGIVAGVGPSPGGESVVATDLEAHSFIIPVDGGPARQLEKLPAQQLPIAWSPDGKALFVVQEIDGPGPTHVGLFDLETGELRPWRDLESPDDSPNPYSIRMSADGKSYVYRYDQDRGDLYLVEGLR
jgi:serine/threonine protein kinase/Tol biopolymer transport system component